MAAEEYRPIVGRLPQRQPGAPRAKSPTSTTASRTRATPAGTTARRRIYLAIQRQPGTNTVEVVDAIKALLPELADAAARPRCSSASAATARCRSASRCDDVKFTLLLTVFLVVLVIFLFLRNLSATIIPSLALPFSIVGTFAVMWALGYSLDNLSLMALTLSVGFVVDDAIVMLENIVRHMEMGKPRMQAALDGSKEIAFTIVSMTLSLAAVFIPILFMGGIVGRLMHEFAVTIARGDSGVGPRVADPDADAVQPLPQAAALDAARLVLQRDRADVRRLAEALRLDADADDPLQGRRRWSSRRCCSSARSICSGSCRRASSRASTPVSSTDRSRRMQGIGFDAIVAHQREIMADPRRTIPNVAAFTANVGGSAAAASLNVDLKPRDERTLTRRQIIEELRPKLARVPGVRVVLPNPPAIRIGGMMSRGAVSVRAAGSRHRGAVSRRAAVRGRAARTSRDCRTSTRTCRSRTPSSTSISTASRSPRSGLTVDQVESALSSAYGSRQVSQIFAPNDEYQVIMQVAPQFQQDPAALSMLYVQATGRQARFRSRRS